MMMLCPGGGVEAITWRDVSPACDDDMTIWWYYDDMMTWYDDVMTRWRSWGGYLKIQLPSRPSLLLTPGACSCFLASIGNLMGIWSKLYHCNAIILVRNEQCIGWYWVNTIYHGNVHSSPWWLYCNDDKCWQCLMDLYQWLFYDDMINRISLSGRLSSFSCNVDLPFLRLDP